MTRSCDCQAAEELRQLRQLMTRPRYFSPKLGLSPVLSLALAILYKREIVTGDQLMSVASPKYHDLSDVDNMAKVTIYKLRRALDPHGIRIVTRYGEGFYMTDKSKELLKPFIIRI